MNCFTFGMFVFAACSANFMNVLYSFEVANVSIGGTLFFEARIHSE
jgi:hypothetical protein